MWTLTGQVNRFRPVKMTINRFEESQDWKLFIFQSLMLFLRQFIISGLFRSHLCQFFMVELWTPLNREGTHNWPAKIVLALWRWRPVLNPARLESMPNFRTLVIVQLLPSSCARLMFSWSVLMSSPHARQLNPLVPHISLAPAHPSYSHALALCSVAPALAPMSLLGKSLYVEQW